MEAEAPPQRAVAIAAGAALLLPTAGLAVVGISERGAERMSSWGLSEPWLVAVALGTAVAGLALGVASWMGSVGLAVARRRAAAGVVVSASVLLVAGAGTVSGAASGLRGSKALRDATEAAVHDFPGWNGGAPVDGASVYVVEVDPHTELATILLRPYDEPFRLLVFGVDNRAGAHEVVLDVDRVRAVRGGAAIDAVVRSERAAHAVRGGNALVEAQMAPVHVPAGERYDGAFALFAPGTRFEDVTRVDVRVGGEVVALRGRYFTASDKRLIDRRTGGAR